MPLITRTELHARFSELAKNADRIDIAVAWAQLCTTLKVLIDSNTPLRIAVGISKNWTDPIALKRLALQEHVQLRIVPDNYQRGTFHPKYYLFRNGQKTVHWVGSANLTGGCFGGNEELVHEFTDNHNEYEQWFEDLWNRLKPDPTTEIEHYESNWIQPPQSPRRKPHKRSKKGIRKLSQITSWADFVDALIAYNNKYHKKEEFDVLGKRHSWLHTISFGNHVIQMRDWQNLALRECHILRGQHLLKQEEGTWGLLGWVRGPGAKIFNPKFARQNRQLRSKIKNQIDRVVVAKPSEISRIASDALDEIWHLKVKPNVTQGIGPAAATRWLALARPDYLVSVNGASAGGLGDAANLPKSSNQLARNYRKLLDWLHNKTWFNEVSESELTDPEEREIWGRRAALVDVFVYRK